MIRLLDRDFLYRAVKIGLWVLLVSYVVPTGGLVTGVYDFPWRLANQIALGLLFGGWLFWKFKTGQGPVKTSIDWVIAAWLTLTLLTTQLSLDRRMSWEVVAYVAIGILWYYTALDLFRREKLLNDMATAVAVMGTVTAVLGVLEYTIAHLVGGWLLSSGRVRSILLNPNILGAFLCLAFGFTLFHLPSARSPAAKRGWVAVLAVIVTVILLTGSRGAWLNLAVLGGCIVGMRLITHPAARGRRRLPLASAVLVLAVVAVLFFVILSSRTSTNRVRVATWRAALEMVADRPLQGVGPGMYGRMLLAYRDPLELTEIHNHAHNTVLTTVAEMGCASALLIAVGALLWGREVWSDFQGQSVPVDRWQRTVSLATLAGFAAHSQVDGFLRYPAFLFLLMPLVAKVTVRSTNVPCSRWWLVLPSVALVLAAAIVVRTTPAYALYHQARIANAQQDWEKTREYLRRAISADPEFLLYRRQLAITQGVAALERQPVREGDYAGFADAFRLSDDFAPDHAYLACLEFWAGDRSAAITEMERALSLDPGNLHYTFNLGMYYEAAGQVDRAEELYQRVLAADPSLLVSDFWDDTPQRQSMLPALVQGVLDSLPEEAYAGRGDILLDAGERDAAKTYYSLQLQMDDPVPGWVGMAKLALSSNDAPASLENANRALSLEPQNTQALLIRARAYLADGDAAAAADDLATALRSDPSPEVLFYLGEAARIQDDEVAAEGWYMEAVRLSMSRWRPLDTHLYARLIGRRLHLPTEHVQCMEWPYSPEAVSLPTAQLFSMYRHRGDEDALHNLRQLLSYSMRW